MRKRRRGFLLEVLSTWVIQSKHCSIKLLLSGEQNEDFIKADSQLLTISVLMYHFLSNRLNLLIPSSCHTSRPPDSTSLLLCCGLTWSESLGPWQRKKHKHGLNQLYKWSEMCAKLECNTHMYSMVPQKVCVTVPSWIDSLQRPKSVSLMCPLKIAKSSNNNSDNISL